MSTLQKHTITIKPLSNSLRFAMIDYVNEYLEDVGISPTGESFGSPIYTTEDEYVIEKGERLLLLLAEHAQAIAEQIHNLHLQEPYENGLAEKAFMSFLYTAIEDIVR